MLKHIVLYTDLHCCVLSCSNVVFRVDSWHVWRVLSCLKEILSEKTVHLFVLLVYHAFAGNVRTSTKWTEDSLPLYEKFQVVHAQVVQVAFFAVLVSLNVQSGTTANCDLLGLLRTDDISPCYYGTAQMKRPVAIWKCTQGDFLIVEMKKSQNIP